MAIPVQESLFDLSERRQLGEGAWLDVRPGWLSEESSELVSELQSVIPWRAERRRMYDRVLDVPRLVSFHDLATGAAPHPATLPRRRLNDIYAGELGEPFTTVGLCLYRHGGDSVAWHGDTITRRQAGHHGRDCQRRRHPHTGPAPARGGAALRLAQHHGDLVVMGGSCQRTWEHSIPKTATPTGPRISIQFRPRGVR